MGEVTTIGWTDHTFNGWIGCDKVSPGCKHCYAEHETPTRVARSKGIELWGPKASRQITTASYWRKPIAWNKAAVEAGVHRRVFTASLSDVFEDRPDLDEPRARLFRLVRETPQLDWLLLTKRPENAARLWRMAALSSHGWDAQNEPPVWGENVWLGTTCEDQEHALERIPHLLAVPARGRFLSIEPQLGRVDLRPWLGDGVHSMITCLRCDYRGPGPAHRCTNGLDWVICGGESGAKARPFDLAWARTLKEDCARADVRFFMKQCGAKPTEEGVPLALKDSHGAFWDEWPSDLRVRQFPLPHSLSAIRRRAS